MRQSQELAHFGVLQWDIAGNRLSWSKEMYAIFGIDPNVEITQDEHYNLLHPEDREEARGLIDKLFRSKQDQIFEERVIRPDGEVRHLRTWVRLKTDKAGEPVQMIGACIDITENKRYEEMLLASERRLRNILDSQTNYVVRISLDFKYRYANKKFVEDFAFKGEVDMIGSDAFRTVREDQKDEVKDVIYQCIAHPGIIGTIELDKLSPRYPDRATFWNFVCLTDSEGNPSEIQAIGIDVSERKKAEKDREAKTLELEASEKRYSDLFHLSPQPMYLFDTDTLKFLDVNNAAISQYGYSREEFLSMTIEDIKSPEDKMRLAEEMAFAKRNAIDIYRSSFIHLTKNGEAIQVELHSNLIPFKDHSARLVLASNITERMEYLKALEVQNKKLTEIAWAQSHVVRAPLARIMALIDMIKNYPELTEENQELLGYVFTSAVELDDVIREISRKAEAVTLEDPN
jgi:PAS domain S-box-containing protein